MNRREAIRTVLQTTAAASVLRVGTLAAQQPDASDVWINPSTGADTNSGAKASPCDPSPKPRGV